MPKCKKLLNLLLAAKCEFSLFYQPHSKYTIRRIWRGGVPIGTRSVDALDDDSFRPDSTFRQSFRQPQVESWQRGNVTRYGQNLQPWANSFRASRGIVPTINALDLDVTTKTTPTNAEAFATGLQFSNRFSTTSSRRAPTTLSEDDIANIHRVVAPEAAEALESWLRAAPGFEGEVIKRMLRDVTTSLETPSHTAEAPSSPLPASTSKTTTSTAASSDKVGCVASSTSPSGRTRSRTPDPDVVSKWGGPVTSVV
ncbi:hypothetical protein PTSG_10084 [Salpingoeca rosetta]|uniref:Uncharacterized protein n=1 Tax=Salpingoeca rosetta (strain ATCC 50818 / BSB-021) TaxID=946362 RepID=F2UPF8_SALR5|nr:uncharacterized protein PTSG_10084 [Salpingoeca rosetta]EGD79513.1 hypothetical protein PTSG_10084 [Salpingoeca rosetta]|eukprot:XP_004988994.1 hypothetical protein PTSG_10084 [Salpingoeca rosetta]